VNILTSTVIECQRAGLKASAYEYAVQLMRPEHRPSIDATIKKKIEAIVRRRTDKEEVPEELSMCPVSQVMIPVTLLECPSTRDALPMCVVTGRHMTLDDWCFCPVSKSPALLSAYRKHIETEIDNAREAAREFGESKEGTRPVICALDPVLGKPVSSSDLKLCSAEEAKKYIQKYNNVLEEKKKKKKEGEDGDEGDEVGGGDETGELGDGKDEDGKKGSSKKSKKGDGPGASRASKIRKERKQRR